MLQSVLQIGADGSGKDLMRAATKSMQDLAAGRPVQIVQIPDNVASAIVHRGIAYVNVLRHRKAGVLDAYRASDGKLVARRQLDRDTLELVGAVAGHPLSRTKQRVLRREPDGPEWTAPGNDAEITFARGVGTVLVVLAKRRDMGNDCWDLTGLDATTLAQLWRIENLGYVYGELAYDDSRVIVTIQDTGAQRFVAIDPASGTRLWEAPVPREEGTACIGGLVYQTLCGTTVFAETGQRIFPTDQRTATPPAPTPKTFITDDKPEWGTVKASATATGAARSRAWIFVIVAVLVVAAIAALVIVKMKK
jgi:outer membrane protein assembly factor BamB